MSKIVLLSFIGSIQVSGLNCARECYPSVSKGLLALFSVRQGRWVNLTWFVTWSIGV